MGNIQYRTTIGIKASTKAKLDKYKAPGQCYDGFIYQLVNLWEEIYDQNIEGNDFLKKIPENWRCKY